MNLKTRLGALRLTGAALRLLNRKPSATSRAGDHPVQGNFWVDRYTLAALGFVADPHGPNLVFRRDEPKWPTSSKREWVIGLICAGVIELGKLAWHVAKARGLF
ncbi:hypothetical protein AB0I84_11095 [Streptomyces spectabilis]|uniref:hypothetical protein n=1 Tax=Streptomyces spectabilis TaxID=68270 RepID=UPI0033FEE3E1